jgi:hypothetical protein
MRLPILLAALVLLPLSAATAQPPGPPEPPGEVMLLVQSELDYLEAADRRVSIDFVEEPPARVLDRLGKTVPLDIAIVGRFPAERRLTATFRHATVRQVLGWFARQLDVYYSAEGPDELRVLVLERAEAPD